MWVNEIQPFYSGLIDVNGKLGKRDLELRIKSSLLHVAIMNEK